MLYNYVLHKNCLIVIIVLMLFTSREEIECQKGNQEELTKKSQDNLH